MFNKIQNFVNDPETKAMVKSAVISVAVGIVASCAINIAVVGATVAVQAVANAINGETKEEE